MKVLGLVLELNPFHKGHQYFIDEAKKQINPDLTIAVISSSFSMRGEPMVIDKWEKSKIALNHGIDMVIELPFLSSVCSADYFCYNAIKSLVSFNITDLAFGVELNNLEKLLKIKEIINTEAFNLNIKTYLDKGFSYGNSSYKALAEMTNDKEIIDNYSLPNNTLAIGYLNSLEKLNANVNITLIKRISNNYYDEEINDTPINSATSLRNLLISNIDISDYTPNINYPYFNPVISNNNLLFILRYLFNTLDISVFQKFLGVNEGIENRIKSFINQVTTYDELISNVQTRRYPANRIKRTLLYIILNIDKAHENNYHNYLRILSMNQKGKKYVNTLSKEIKKQIITSFKNQNNYLVNIELQASKLFGLINNQPELYLQEYNVPFIGEDENEHKIH